jgi:hypothetical protein
MQSVRTDRRPPRSGALDGRRTAELRGDVAYRDKQGELDAEPVVLDDSSADRTVPRGGRRGRERSERPQPAVGGERSEPPLKSYAVMGVIRGAAVAAVTTTP